jgi:hypothetical protein
MRRIEDVVAGGADQAYSSLFAGRLNANVYKLANASPHNEPTFARKSEQYVNQDSLV